MSADFAWDHSFHFHGAIVNMELFRNECKWRKVRFKDRSPNTQSGKVFSSFASRKFNQCCSSKTNTSVNRLSDKGSFKPIYIQTCSSIEFHSFKIDMFQCRLNRLFNKNSIINKIAFTFRMLIC